MHAAWIVRSAGAKPDASQTTSLNPLWSAAANSGSFPTEVNRTASFHTCWVFLVEKTQLWGRISALKEWNHLFFLQWGKEKTSKEQNSFSGQVQKAYVPQKLPHFQMGDEGENRHQKSCTILQLALFGEVLKRTWHAEWQNIQMVKQVKAVEYL